MKANKQIAGNPKIQKARKALQAGKFSEAKSLLNKFCKQNRRDTEAWLLLTAANGQLGDMKAVIECCQQVLQIQPSHPTALSNMGNAHASLGHQEEAAGYYEQALKLKPNDPAILHNLGLALLLAGQTEESITHFQKALSLRPDYTEAHCNMGKALLATEKLEDAAESYQKALKFNPELYDAHLGLANTLNELVVPDLAEEHYRKAIKIKPDATEAYTGLSAVIRYQGRLDEAIDICHKILELAPEQADALNRLADLFQRKGNSEKAYAQIRELIESDRLNSIAADTYTRICNEYNCCDDAISRSNQLLENGNTKKGERQTLHFSRGKLHDKRGEYDLAFTHYKQSNDLTHYPFDKEKFSAEIDALIEAYSKEALTQLPHSTNQSELPVFIVGMPRSSTSLTEQILASHPDVFGAGELNNINEIVGSLPVELHSNQPHPACLKQLKQENIDNLAQQHLTQLKMLSSDALRITDKMPHNFMNLGLISLMFPRAMIIHCLRDPIDTCLSIYFQKFGPGHAYATDLKNLGFYYRQYLRLMQHWETVIDTPMMTVHYKDTIADQERVSRELVDFIGLPWDEQCLQFHKAKRHVATASYDQVRQKIYTRSLARWKNYEQHIGPLIEALGDTVENTG